MMNGSETLASASKNNTIQEKSADEKRGKFNNLFIKFHCDNTESSLYKKEIDFSSGDLSCICHMESPKLHHSILKKEHQELHKTCNLFAYK